MLQTLLLGICVASLGFCFWAANKTNKKEKKSPVASVDRTPPELKAAFYDFASELMEKEHLTVQDLELVEHEMIREVPYDDGAFLFYLVDFLITPKDPFEELRYDHEGNEIDNPALGPKPKCFRGRIIMLFFRNKEGCSEIAFISEEKARNQGYNAYIDSRYAEAPIVEPSSEYKVIIGGQEIHLGDNIAGMEMEGFEKTRVKAREIYAKHGYHMDYYDNEDVEIEVWVQFEHKREIITAIRLKTYKGELPTGIRVGSTVSQLKAAYSELSYLELYECLGPAYGYIPDDDTFRYVAFKVHDDYITEIVVHDGLNDRRFTPRDCYIDQDVPWIKVDNSDKFNEKYARSLYLGQNKADFEPRQVFNNFVAKTFELGSVIEKGVWREDPTTSTIKFYVICEIPSDDGFGRLYGEAELCQVAIESLTKDRRIWIVDRYRTQKKGI